MNLCLYQIHVHLPHWLSLMKVFDSCMIFGIDPCLRYSIYYSTLPSLKHTKTVNLLIGFLFILLFFSPIVKHIALLYHSWAQIECNKSHILQVSILCNDCNTTSNAPFHIFGLKCSNCDSYNTRRISAADHQWLLITRFIEYARLRQFTLDFFVYASRCFD